MEAVQLLHDFNIRRIEQLMALPRADLPSRFGFEMLLRLDQALGVVAELLKPERTPEPIEESWPFEPPIVNRRHVETAIAHLLEKLLERLRPRQIGVRRLLCSLQLLSHEPLHFSAELLQPSHSHRHLMELVSLRLERLTIAAEVSGIRLQAAFAAPLEFHQEHLFAEGERANWWRSFSALLERLSGRLGEKYVLRPRLWPDPQPEFACRYEPWLKRSVEYAVRSTEHPVRRRQPPGAQHLVLSTEYSVPSTQHLDLRPPHLTGQPIALPVVSVIPGGPPIRFHWKNNHYIVAHSWGPERIETGWWRGADIRRDYYLVESTQGERFWLFRSLPDEIWFLHGVFM
jgi:protein ImuB